MSTSDFIDAMDSISRDLENEKEEVAALLRRRGAEHVEELGSRIEHELSEVEEAIERGKAEVEEEVERTIRMYGPETTPEARREAAHQVARGFGSDLFAEAMRRLREAAQQTQDERRQLAREGRRKHVRRLIRTLSRRQRRREDLKFRLKAVRDALRRWTLGEFEEQQQEKEASTEDAELIQVLTTPSRRLEWISEKLVPLRYTEGKTWDDLNDLLDQERKRLGIERQAGLPYASGRTMSKAVQRHRERRTGES